MIYGRITAEEALAQNLNWDSDLEEISSAEDLSETEDDITDPDFQFQHHSQDPRSSAAAAMKTSCLGHPTNLQPHPTNIQWTQLKEKGKRLGRSL